MNTLAANAMFLLISILAGYKFLGGLYYTSSARISSRYTWERIRPLGVSGLVTKILDPGYYANCTIRRRSFFMIGVDAAAIAGFLFLLYQPCRLWQLICFLFFAPLLRMTVAVTVKDAIMTQELASNTNVADLWLNMAKDIFLGVVLYTILLMLN